MNIFKKLLSVLLIIILMYWSFNYSNASNNNLSHKINSVMEKFYLKLDNVFSDTNKKILKLETINKKIEEIKNTKWNKISVKSRELLIIVEFNIKNKIEFYKNTLKKENINLSDLLWNLNDSNTRPIDTTTRPIDTTTQIPKNKTFISVRWNKIITSDNTVWVLRWFSFTPEYTNKWLYDNFLNKYMKVKNKRVLSNDIIVLTNKNTIHNLLYDISTINSYSSDLWIKNWITYWGGKENRLAKQIFLNGYQPWVTLDKNDPFIKNNIVNYSNMTKKRISYRIFRNSDDSEVLIYKDTYGIKSPIATSKQKTFISVKWNRIITSDTTTWYLKWYNVTPEYTNNWLYNNFLNKYMNISSNRVLANDIVVLTDKSSINQLVKKLDKLEISKNITNIGYDNWIAYSTWWETGYPKQIYLNNNSNGVGISSQDPFISNWIVKLSNMTNKSITYRIYKSNDNSELLIYKDTYSIESTQKPKNKTFISVKWNRIITSNTTTWYLKWYNVTPEYTNNWLYNNFINKYMNLSSNRVLSNDIVVLTDKNNINNLINEVENLNNNKNQNTNIGYNNWIAYTSWYENRDPRQIFLNNNSNGVGISSQDPFISNWIVKLSNMTKKRITYRIYKSNDNSELLIYKDTYSIHK